MAVGLRMLMVRLRGSFMPPPGRSGEADIFIAIFAMIVYGDLFVRSSGWPTGAFQLNLRQSPLWHNSKCVQGGFSAVSRACS